MRSTSYTSNTIVCCTSRRESPHGKLGIFTSVAPRLAIQDRGGLDLHRIHDNRWRGSLRLLDILLTLAFSWFYDWYRPGVLCLSFRDAFLLKAPELLFVNFSILSVTDSLSFPVALLSGLDRFRDSLAGDLGYPVGCRYCFGTAGTYKQVGLSVSIDCSSAISSFIEYHPSR